MALKEVAVVGCTLTLKTPVTGTPPTFTGTPATKVKAGGQFVYKDNTQVTVASGTTDGTCTTSVPGIGNMPATALKNNVEGVAPLRVDDEVTISGIVGVLSGGGGCTLNVTVQITDAGQTKVRAE